MIKPILKGEIGSVCVKPEASEQYNDELQNKLKKTVWSSCVSYYNQNARGAKNVGTSTAFPLRSNELPFLCVLTRADDGWMMFLFSSYVPWLVNKVLADDVVPRVERL